MSFRPTHYPCSDTKPHPGPHDHTDGPDSYYYTCPGVPDDEPAGSEPRLVDTGNFFVQPPRKREGS